VASVELGLRKQQILAAIIAEYINTVEPVGSRTIARKYKLGISPATIRNEMADLEDMGFIEQPHTSAGRIPSESGYRYYVDCLMQKQKLSEEEERLIRQEFHNKTNDIGQVIKNTGQLLAQMTSYASVVQLPRIGTGLFRHIQLIDMGIGRALLVVVMDNGLLQNQMIDVPTSITGSDLATISEVLNAKLKGHTMETIKFTLIKEVYMELVHYKHVLDLVLDILKYSLTLSLEEKVYLIGLFNILNQPEFHDIEKVKTILGLLGQENLLASIFADISQPGVNVRIGTEINCQAIKDCSIVLSTYEMEDQPIGAIGVLGPVRMDYAKVVSIVDYMTKNLSLVFERLLKSGGK
jgi:heat-inducible transcriptional repressor